MSSVENSHRLAVGNVLRLELGNGIVCAWEIISFYHGNLGEESVIEIEVLGIKPPQVPTCPGASDYWRDAQMFVPASLIYKAIEAGLLVKYVVRS